MDSDQFYCEFLRRRLLNSWRDYAPVRRFLSTTWWRILLWPLLRAGR